MLLTSFLRTWAETPMRTMSSTSARTAARFDFIDGTTCGSQANQAPSSGTATPVSTCWRIDAGVPNRSTLMTHALAGIRPAWMVRLPDDFCLDEPAPFLVAPAGMGAAACQPARR